MVGQFGCKSPSSAFRNIYPTTFKNRWIIDFDSSSCHPARMAKPALGRGLGALLGGSPAIANSAPVAQTPAIIHSTTTTHAVPATVPHAVIPAPVTVSRDAVRRVPVAQVKPCSFQPRKDFPQDALRELSDSIREQGIVQPLIVRPMGNNFEIIAGERRWRAAQLAGLTEVPVIVRDADDRAVLEMG